MFDGAGLAGDFGETDEERFGEAGGAIGEDGDGLVFGGALENNEIEVFDAAGEFGAQAEGVVEFFEAFVEESGVLEIEISAGLLAIGFDRRAKRVAAGVQKLDEALHFGGVLLWRAAGKAGCEAHFHFRVDATGKRGVAANFDLTAANFEEVESLLREDIGGFAGREGAVVSAGGGKAGIVDGNAASDIAARIGVAQTDFEDGGRAKAGEFAIALGEQMFGDVVVGDGLLEFGAGEAIANARGEIAKVEAFGAGIGWPEEALKAAAKILSAEKEGLGVGGVGFDEADSGTRRERGEEEFVARRVEVLAAVKFEHENRI